MILYNVIINNTYEEDQIKCFIPIYEAIEFVRKDYLDVNKDISMATVIRDMKRVNK